MTKSLPFLASILCASLALAEPPTPTQTAASALVEKKLLEPLQRAEGKRSRFSRSAPVPVARRVRVLDAVAQTDARGKAFVRFAIDVQRRGLDDVEWHEAAMLGCAYPNEQKVFIQRDDGYVPARGVLGEEVEPKPNVCRAAPADGATVAAAARS
jgi:hypothetical protein